MDDEKTNVFFSFFLSFCLLFFVHFKQQQNPNNGFLKCSNPFGQLHTLSISLALDSQMEQHILDHIFRLCTHLQRLGISIPVSRIF